MGQMPFGGQVCALHSMSAPQGPPGGTKHMGLLVLPALAGKQTAPREQSASREQGLSMLLHVPSTQSRLQQSSEILHGAR
jgi:hypothetical protein